MGTIYTCPMHPQIRRDAPGNCPICGMTLEPLVVAAEAGPNEELIDMTRRLWIGAVLALPVFALEMGGHIPALGLHRLVPPIIATWIEFVLSTPVVLWAGWPFFERAWTSLVNRSLNMFSLIALGTGTSYLYSLVATFAPGLFPAGFRMQGGAVPVYFEAAAVIVVLALPFFLIALSLLLVLVLDLESLHSEEARLFPGPPPAPLPIGSAD